MRVLTLLMGATFLLFMPFDAAATTSMGASPVLRPAPVYPPEAKKDGIEGYVIVEFTINTNGRTSDILVIESEPQGVFDKAAIRAVTRWEYEPEIVDGEPQASRIQVQLDFELDE